MTPSVFSSGGMTALAPGIEFVGATGRFGARYISSRAAYAIAGHAALDAWANAEGAFDAVILARGGTPVERGTT